MLKLVSKSIDHSPAADLLTELMLNKHQNRQSLSAGEPFYVNQHNKIVSQILLYTFLVIYSIRYFIYYLNYRMPDGTEYFHDPAVSIFLQSFTSERTMGLVFAPVPLILVYIDYYAHIGSRHNPLVDLAAELVVQNGKHFWLLNPKLKVQQHLNWRKPMVWSRVVLRQLQLLWHCDHLLSRDLIKFNDNLSLFAHVLHDKLRVRLVLISFVSERIQTILVRIGGILTLIVVLYFTILAYQQYSIGMCLLVGIQSSVHFYATWKACCLMLTAAHCGCIGCYTISSILKRLNRALSSVTRKCRKGTKEVNLPLYLAYYWGTHSWVIFTVIITNRHCISPVYLMVCLTTYPTCVYIVSILLFQSNSFATFSILLFTVAICGIIILFIFTSHLCIAMTNSVHSSDQLLYQLQFFLGSNMIRKKLKLLSYYQLLHTNRKFYFTMGSVGRVTRNSVFQMLLLYIAYILNAYKIIDK